MLQACRSNLIPRWFDLSDKAHSSAVAAVLVPIGCEINTVMLFNAHWQ
jgi:hypothetical protein